MKKKILVGLLASVLVCLTFVFTNAIDPTYSVSGTVTVYDEDNNMMDGQIYIDVYRGSKIISSDECLSGDRFNVKVRCSDVVTFSSTNPETDHSTSWNTNYCSNHTNLQVGLHSDGTISND